MKRKIYSTAAMLLCSLCTISVSQALFVSGYEVVASGEVIGFVENMETLERITQKINSEITDSYGINPQIEKDINLVRKTATKNALSTVDELQKNISEISGFMSEAYVLNISGEEVFAIKEYSQLLELLQNQLAKYKIDDGKTEFCEIIEYEKKYVTKTKIYTYEQAEEYLQKEKKLNVKTTVQNEYKASVGFDTIKRYDNSMYKGSTVIIREGVTGESLVTDEISYVNGEEVSRKTIKEKIIKEPVAEIQSVGTLEPPPGFGTGEFISPIKGMLTSEYGERWGSLHGGIDLAAQEGTQICASDNGTVIFAGELGSYGLLMKVDHGNGYVTYYAHCSGFIANVGDCVTKGEAIALVGSTGNSTGPHCHFEIRYNNEQLNPLELVK